MEDPYCRIEMLEYRIKKMSDCFASITACSETAEAILMRPNISPGDIREAFNNVLSARCTSSMALTMYEKEPTNDQ